MKPLTLVVTLLGLAATSACAPRRTRLSQQCFTARFPAAHPPALRIKSGERVITTTVDGAGVGADGKPSHKGPNPVDRALLHRGRRARRPDRRHDREARAERTTGMSPSFMAATRSIPERWPTSRAAACRGRSTRRRGSCGSISKASSERQVARALQPADLRVAAAADARLARRGSGRQGRSTDVPDRTAAKSIAPASPPEPRSCCRCTSPARCCFSVTATRVRATGGGRRGHRDLDGRRVQRGGGEEEGVAAQQRHATLDGRRRIPDRVAAHRNDDYVMAVGSARVAPRKRCSMRPANCTTGWTTTSGSPSDPSRSSWARRWNTRLPTSPIRT